jgi:putative transposase
MYFFTATINSWQSLLEEITFKKIILDSLYFMHHQKRAQINGFVIMPNHIHLLWTPIGNNEEELNENALLSFTAHQFKNKLKLLHPEQLKNYVSTQNDREYHFWERRPRTIEVLSRKIAEQKLEYIHSNPCHERWNLAPEPSMYYYSSAALYETELDDFKFLTHLNESL